MFEETRIELETELDDQDYEDTGFAALSEIYKSMKILGIMTGTFDDDIKDFIQFLAMRHSKSLEEVKFAKFLEPFNEDYNYLEDTKSIWADLDDNGDDIPAYEPSSEEDEMESEEVEEERPITPEPVSPPKRNVNESEVTQNTNNNELQQNVLLEKVDEILMQIVKSLPDQHKIRTLTKAMMPYLSPIFDQQARRQYLIINQNNFIQFLLGQGDNQLGLQLD